MRIFFALLALGLFSGCAMLFGEKLPPLPAGDQIKIEGENGRVLPVLEIKDPAKQTALVAFVNALPSKWSVPWYGPPVGQIYFKFFRDGKFVGNFYVGPNFFGRDGSNFWSQSASKRQMDQLSEIVGFDVWTSVHEKR
jgi:hypothetical protein